MAAISSENPTFQYLQLTHILKKYEEHNSINTKQLLSQAGVKKEHLDTFAEGLIRFVRGDLFTHALECQPTIEPNALVDSWFVDDASNKERLEILYKAGPIALWSSLQFVHFKEFEADPKIKDVSKRANIHASIAQQCHRISQLIEAFKAIDGTSDKDIKALVKKLYQTPDKQQAVKRYSFLTSLVEAKTKLFNFQNEMLYLAEADASLKEAILNLVRSSDDINTLLANGYWVDDLEQIIKNSIRRKASVTIMRQINRLESKTLSVIEKKLANQGLDIEAIKAGRKALAGLQALENKLFAKTSMLAYEYEKKVLALELQVYRSVGDIKEALEEDVVKSASKVTSITNKLAKQTDTVTKSYCSDDKIGSSIKDLANSNSSWGQLPTKEKPVGYRIKVRPVHNTGAGIKDMHYKAILELLLWLPPSIHVSAGYTDKKGNKITCPNSSSPTIRSIDLGFEILDVKLIDSFTNEARQYIFTSANSLKASISANQEKFQDALMSLGIPGAWIDSKPGLRVDRDFKNITIKTNLNTDDVPVEIDIVKNGQFSLDLTSFGRYHCKAIEEKFATQLIGNWAQNFKLEIDQWKASLSTDTKLNVEACDILYQDKYTIDNGSEMPAIDSIQYPRPLESSALSITTKLDLTGNLFKAPFKWQATASLEADPQGEPGKKVKLKSLVLSDKIPNIVRKKIESHIATLDKQFTRLIPGTSDKLLNVRFGGVTLIDDQINISVLMDARQDECESDLLSASFSIPSGKFSVDDTVLKSSIKKVISCAGKQALSQAAYKAVNCKSIESSIGKKQLFGLDILNSQNVNIPGRAGINCEISVKGSLLGKDLTLTGIIGTINLGKVSLDFSKMEGLKSLERSVQAYVSKLTSSLSKKGVEISDSRIGKNGVSFNIILKGSNAETGAKIEPMDLGRLTVTYDGQLNLKSQIGNILVKRLKSIYEPPLIEVAKRYAPKQIQNLKLHVSFNEKKDELEIFAGFKLEIYKDIVIPAKIKFSPKFSAKIDVNQSTLESLVKDKLLKHVKSLLDFGDSIKIKDIQYVNTQDMGIALRTGIKIKLANLGSIDLDGIYIGTKGLKLNGRAELRVDTFIYLTPAPPLLITEPGVYYDFEQNKVGVLGSLTIIEASLADIVKITGDFSVGDPDNFLKVLILEGEAILMDTVPILVAQGTINLAKLRADFSANTSEMLKKILSLQIQGHLDVKNEDLGMNSELEVFGVKLSRADIQILLKKCPKECINAYMAFNLPIGGADMDVRTGPFLIQGYLKTTFKLKVYKYRIAKAKLLVKLLRADLGFDIFGIGVDVSTGSIDEMTPRYLARIIASLLEIKLEDILKWLKNPKIKIAPAGSPSDGSGSKNGGDSPSTGGSSGERSNTGNGAPSDKETKDKEEKKSKGPIKKPPINTKLRNKKGNVVGSYACRKSDRSWGLATYHHNNTWYYSTYYIDINKQSWDKICAKKIKNILGAGTFAIDDIYRPIKSSVSITPRLGELDCPGEGLECSALSSYSFNEQTTKHIYNVKPLIRQLSQAGTSKIGTKERDLSIDITVKQIRRLTELLDNDDKTKSAILADKKIAHDWIKEAVRKIHGIELDVITDVDPDWIWLWNSPTDMKNYKIYYKNNVPVSPQNAYQYASIWAPVNDASNKIIANKAIIVESCRVERIIKHKKTRWWSAHEHRGYWYKRGEKDDNISPVKCDKPHLDSTNGKHPDKIIQDALKNVKTVADPDTGDTLVNIQDLSWLVSDVLTSIFTQTEIAPKGKIIPSDDAISPNCKVTSIRVTDLGRYVRFTTFTKSKGITEAKNFDVYTTGSHRKWLKSDNDAYKSSMGTLLACLPNATSWLSEHKLWYGEVFDNGPLGSTLLFRNSTQREQNPFVKVTQVVNNLPVSTFEVERKLPYNLSHSEKIAQTLYLKILDDGSSNKRKLEKYSLAQLYFVTNEETDSEYTIAKTRLTHAKETNYRIEMRQYCTDVRNKKSGCSDKNFIKSKAGHTFVLPQTKLAKCLTDLGVYGSTADNTMRLKNFLSEVSPVTKYGASPLPILTSLHNASKQPGITFKCN